MGSCTQCHVEQSFTTLGMHGALGTSFGSSAFKGAEAPRKGTRAFPEAPPTIPHTTHMRENCLACHGAAGSAPLRTSHPSRVSCQQCHVPSSTSDVVAKISSKPCDRVGAAGTSSEIV